MYKYLSILLGLFLSMQWASANPQVMKTVYQNYDETAECYIGIQKSSLGFSKYCMRMHMQKTADDKSYYLTVGHHADSHQFTMNSIGLIVENINSAGEILGQKKLVDVGILTDLPTQYHFQQLGDDDYGFFATADATELGITRGNLLIVGDQDGEVFSSTLPIMYENDQTSESLQGTYRILDRHQADIYPIEVRLTGQYHGQIYRQVPYVAVFDAEQNTYRMPDDYPLNDRHADNATVYLSTINDDSTACKNSAMNYDQAHLSKIGDTLIKMMQGDSRNDVIICQN